MKIRAGFAIAAVAAAACLAGRDTEATASQFMDYFMPTPIIGSLPSTCWDAAQVGARDQSNGLADKAHEQLGLLGRCG
jgi:hypothetical protein